MYDVMGHTETDLDLTLMLFCFFSTYFSFQQFLSYMFFL